LSVVNPDLALAHQGFRTRHANDWPLGGFTLLHLVILICLVAVLALLAMPALTDALNNREMTRTMNNARALYLAGFRMATEGAAKADASRAWPGDYDATSLADYCTKLVQHDYLKAGDLQKFLSAPGAICNVTVNASPPKTVTLTGKSALKVYKVTSTDSSNAIFSASANYIYDTPLSPTAVPFGDKGFVVVRKSGDAGVYRKNQATPAGYNNDTAKFQSELGRLPGAADSAVGPGDGVTVLIGPQ
jgi:type II secretory pathway pseudopilin PulG